MKRYIVLITLLVISCIMAKPNNDSLSHDDSLAIKAWPRLFVSAGSFLSAVNTRVSVGSKDLGLGVEVDLEDALGLKTSNFIFRLNSEYKFGKIKKHGITVNYFAFIRKSSKVISKEIEIGDRVFEVGTKLQSNFNINIIKAAYNLSFFKDSRVNLSFNGGLYIMPLFLTVAADDKESNNLVDFIAPLPYLGLSTAFKITDKLYMKHSGDLLYVKVGSYSGSIIDLTIRLEYNAFKYLGFGGGVDLFKLNVSANGNEDDYPRFVGEINLEYSGVTFYITSYF